MVRGTILFTSDRTMLATFPVTCSPLRAKTILGVLPAVRINLDIPDDIAHCPTFSRADWLRETAIFLFEQERVTLVELAGFRISHQLYQKVLKFVDEI